MLYNSGNILFISNEERDLNRFRMGFVEHYNVFTASKLDEAVKHLREYDIHVVLVKQQMPEMTGLQFCESIAQKYPEVIKIILNDTKDKASLERAALTNLIYRFVQAPFQNTDLKMTIDGAIRLSEAHYKNKKLEQELEQYRKDRDKIMNLFKRYVPGEVINQSLHSKAGQSVSPGESRVVSVLFADIRGFSNFTSQLRPEQIVEFLNDYWEIITECIQQNKGSVNKYMGDGLLAVFGAPISDLNNHENAVTAALEMVHSLKDINAMYSEVVGTEVKIGIGINSGEVIVGNVGTDNFMEYTVIGDTVNIASRLESISKNKPNSIIISEQTYKLVKDKFETTSLQEAPISGRDETLTFCEVLGRKPGNIHRIQSYRG
ncbi:MAG: adenylate/guanylate cyclase domain-containing protein [Balneolaceae bacterium]|nr:adenylate/guanylate cyclase domain-containing protein [Balneolaceae bacterium]